MNEILKFNDVKKYYKGERGKIVRALNGVSFSVKEDSIFTVIGESGSGKTTIAMIASFLEFPTHGKVIFKNETFKKSFNKRSIWKEVQLIFQDPGRSLNPKKKVEFLLKEPLLNYSICPPKGIDKKIDFLMELLGMERSLKNRKAEELSGGEKQRLAIARALLVTPSLLILDEPFSFIDPVVKSQILFTLLDYRKKNRMAWIFITHDLKDVNFFTESLVILYKGLIMESGNVDILENPYHPYTKFLIFPEPKENFEMTSDKGCPFSISCDFKKELCKSTLPELKFINRRFVRCHLY